ncbi:MAG: RNA polymerase sigma factor [Saprospiraceae bacterium]
MTKASNPLFTGENTFSSVVKLLPLDEKQFIQALQQGSQQAFSRLVEQFQQQVLNTCLGFVPRLQDAEDLTQEVFLEVFRSIGNFRAEAKLSTWIYRVTVRKCLEYIRYQNRQKRWAFMKNLVGLDTPEAQSLASGMDHPGIALENQERSAILFLKMEELVDNQRTAFVLHKVEGLSHQEISEILQVSIASVESLIFRAKQQLQKKLERYYQDLKT